MLLVYVVVSICLNMVVAGLVKPRRLLQPVSHRMELPKDFPVNLSMGIAESPLLVEKLIPWLNRYPDRQAARFLMNGLKDGFSLNADLDIAHVHFENLSSALQRPDIVLPLLAKEIRAGRLSGPHPHPPMSMRVSPIGIVKKSQDDSLARLLADSKHGTSLDGDSAMMGILEEDLSSSQEYRLIFDLSAHDQWGDSVNSTTSENFKSTHYTSFDSVVEKVSLLPKMGMCSKSDVKSAFRIIKLAAIWRLVVLRSMHAVWCEYGTLYMGGFCNLFEVGCYTDFR